MPIMVGSSRCHNPRGCLHIARHRVTRVAVALSHRFPAIRRCNLRGLSPVQLVSRHEERTEIGGYFIANGNERAIRLLIAPRRNTPLGLVRSASFTRSPYHGA